MPEPAVRRLVPRESGKSPQAKRSRSSSSSMLASVEPSLAADVPKMGSMGLRWTRPKRVEVRSHYLVLHKRASGDACTDGSGTEPAANDITAVVPLPQDPRGISMSKVPEGYVVSVTDAEATARRSMVSRVLKSQPSSKLLFANSTEAMTWVSHMREACRAVDSSDFKVLARLGSGAYGRVHLVRKQNTQRLYALKRVPLAREAAAAAATDSPLLLDDGQSPFEFVSSPSGSASSAGGAAGGAGGPAEMPASMSSDDEDVRPSKLRHAIAERRALQRAASSHSPYLAHMRFAFLERGHLHYVQDLADGGDLHDALLARGNNSRLASKCRFKEAEVRHIAAEVVAAVGSLHSVGIVHRDIKLENVMLSSDGHVLLTDFGLALVADEGKVPSSSTYCGTERYMPPEMVDGRVHSLPLDWWQVGCLVYELLTGRPPFYSRSPHRQADMITDAVVEFPASVDLSEESRAFVLALLTKEPSQRLGSTGDAEVRAHPFFADIDWAAIDSRTSSPPFAPGLSRKVARIGSALVAQQAEDSSADASSVISADTPSTGQQLKKSASSRSLPAHNEFAGFDFACTLDEELASGVPEASVLAAAAAAKVAVDASAAVDVMVVPEDAQSAAPLTRSVSEDAESLRAVLDGSVAVSEGSRTESAEEARCAADAMPGLPPASVVRDASSLTLESASVEMSSLRVLGQESAQDAMVPVPPPLTLMRASSSHSSVLTEALGSVSAAMRAVVTAMAGATGSSSCSASSAAAASGKSANFPAEDGDELCKPGHRRQVSDPIPAVGALQDFVQADYYSARSMEV